MTTGTKPKETHTQTSIVSEKRVYTPSRAVTYAPDYTFCYLRYDNDSKCDCLFLNCDPTDLLIPNPDKEDYMHEEIENPRWEGWSQLFVRYNDGILEWAGEDTEGVFHLHPTISKGLAEFFSGSRAKKVFRGKGIE